LLVSLRWIEHLFQIQQQLSMPYLALETSLPLDKDPVYSGSRFGLPAPTALGLLTPRGVLYVLSEMY
jgi:hypothetical protein